jgi:hypothetical protein
MKINVDKIYVCHWNKLVDRKEILYQQFLKYEIENEIEYVEDFDVEDLDTCLYNDYYKSINSYNSIMRRYTKKSEISLFYKHIKILEMFEDQKEIKTGQKNEEIISYCFLGVFVIYIMDSFVSIGKYSR